MREMNYQKENFVLCLDKGTFEGFNYAIISFGTHPCCYVEIPESHKYFKKDYDTINIDCHGGLTFSQEDFVFNPIVTTQSWWIGWDYAHCRDYMGIYELDYLNNFNHNHLKKWTTEELIEDIKNVIRQLKELK